MAKKKPGKDKFSKLDKQVLILFSVLIIMFIGTLITYNVFNNIKQASNTFEYGGFTITKAILEGTTVEFYLIPIIVEGSNVRENLALRNDPRQLENISAEFDSKLLANIGEVWVTTSSEYDSDAIIASGEILRFTSAVGFVSQQAFTKVELGDFPERTCRNASESVRVIDVRLGNSTTRIYGDGNCIIVEGDTYDGMIKASDKLVFEWLKRLFIGKLE